MSQTKNTTQRKKWDETYVNAHGNEIRDRARRKSKRQHNATGEPYQNWDVAACNAGICPGCSGHFERLYKHVPGCPDIQPPVDSFQGLIDRLLPANQRGLARSISDTERAKSSEVAKRRFDETTPEGTAHREKIAAAIEGSTRIPYWPTIELITSGHSAVKAAELLKERTKTVQERKEKQGGLAFGTDFACDFGYPVRCEHIIASRKASNSRAADFDKMLGFSTKRPPRSVVGPKDALRWIAWRNDIVSRLLAQPENKSYRKDEVLKTLVPQLLIANTFLLKTLPVIRQAAGNKNVDELCEYVLAEARREKTEEWQSTVCFLWQIEPWLLKDGLARLRSDDDDGPIVREMIGSLFGAKQQWVQSAMRDRTGTVKPEDMERWILRLPATSKMAEEKKRYFIVGRDVEKAIPRFDALIASRRALPKRARGNQQRVRDHLTKQGFTSDEIDAGISAHSSLEAARPYVAGVENLQSSVVAKYHRQYLAYLASHT